MRRGRRATCEDVDIEWDETRIPKPKAIGKLPLGTVITVAPVSPSVFRRRHQGYCGNGQDVRAQVQG